MDLPNHAPKVDAFGCQIFVMRMKASQLSVKKDIMLKGVKEIAVAIGLMILVWIVNATLQLQWHAAFIIPKFRAPEIQIVIG
jgi:hypothetical protein